MAQDISSVNTIDEAMEYFGSSERLEDTHDCLEMSRRCIGSLDHIEQYILDVWVQCFEEIADQNEVGTLIANAIALAYVMGKVSTVRGEQE